MYLWLKALHIIAVIAWMAGMLYLPRLFVYHCAAPPGSPQSETFKVMERRLYKAIMLPAVIATWLFGLMLMLTGGWIGATWLHVKLTAVVILSVLHGLLGHWIEEFAHDRNRHSANFFRFVNEIPTVLLIVIVVLATVKPF